MRKPDHSYHMPGDVTGLAWRAALLLLVASVAAPVHAGTLETLLMPGPVIEGHAQYEQECGKCHERFSKSTQRELCMDCHDKVANDVRKNEGYHGRNSGIRKGECRNCHTEHVGRDADIVRLNRETFAHGGTDFPLEGSHLEVRCESCHQADKLYREAPSQCVDCHREDDPHEKRLGESCGDCHEARAWNITRFDHDQTDFPLAGRHKKVSCDSCHPSERYEQIPTNCYSCHALNDAHKGGYGKKCHTCHTPEKWSKTRFDHDKTDFPLTGRHEKVACNACHKGNLHEEKLDTECYACHRNDDQHQGRNGKKCGACHTPKSWAKARFDHDRETDFALRGSHKGLDCLACHRGHLYDDKLDSKCYSCHRADDVHKGQEGKQCQRCHNEHGWADKVVFDHDLTRFPLIGLHAGVACEECHLTAAYRDTALQCFACHEEDDDHKLHLGPKCGLCHNPNSWRLWEFDHDTQTNFVLDGKHEGLTCLACHTKRAPKKMRQSKRCHTCHKKDDAHQGRFGGNCERCHSTESFRQADFAP